MEKFEESHEPWHWFEPTWSGGCSLGHWERDIDRIGQVPPKYAEQVEREQDGGEAGKGKEGLVRGTLTARLLSNGISRRSGDGAVMMIMIMILMKMIMIIMMMMMKS